MAIVQLREPRMNLNDSMAPERGEANAQTVIDIKDLSLVFETNDGPVHALSNIDLAVKRGEFVSFIDLRDAARLR
jgi:NitT/TauT family transport system ATP-binding protein